MCFSTFDTVNHSLQLVFLLFIVGSPDLKKGYQETRNVFRNLRFCGNQQTTHSTINKYIENLTFTRLRAFGLQIVTFEI